MDTTRPVAVVAGVGPGIGAAMARRFHGAGYAVALIARDAAHTGPVAAELEHGRGYACDVGDAASVAETLARIRAELGTVDVLLYNAGAGVWGDVETVTPEGFELAWRVNAFGAFLCSREVIAGMKAKGAGAIVLTGATASRRGVPRTAAFAPAKAAQRSLAESMARSLWPAGIHVALIIVDGVVELPRARAAFPDRPTEAFVDPAGVAEIAYQLVLQDRRAWSFEVEARPNIESW